MNFKIRRLFTYLSLVLHLGGAFAQKYNLLPDTIRLCEDDSASIEIRPEVGPNARILWRTPRGQIEGAKKIKAKTTGKYFIELAQQNRPTMTDSSYLKFYRRPERILADTTICKGRRIVLDAGNQGMRYLWSTGQQSRRIMIEQAGLYWVKITNGKCALTDTVLVRYRPGSGVSVKRENIFCLNEEEKLLSVKTGTDVEILWSTGATGATIQVVSEGDYLVRTRSAYCGEQTDTLTVKLKACDCEMLIPNSFSPNEDNRNDYFFPVLACDYSFYMMTISDRWGNTVYTSNNATGKWDGRFKGNLCPEDIYIYRIESQEKGSDKRRLRNGHVSLFR